MKHNKSQNNIPDKWQEVKLADIGVFSKGAGILKDEVLNSGLNAVRYGELYTKFNFHIKKIYSFIPENVAATSRKIKYGDIIFAGSGETAEEIGKSAAYLLREDCYAGGDTIIFTPKDADSLFLSYFLNVGEARKKLRELGQGQSVVHIYKSDLENVKLHIPSLPEQKRIVAVLKTWDRAIEKLKKKIELKKEFKTDLTKNLVTGVTRFGQFSNSWKKVLLSDVGQIVSGGTPSTANKDYWSGNIPWISSSDLTENNINYAHVHRFITPQALKGSATNLIPKNSIILVSRVGVGKVLMNKVDICTSQDFQSLIIKDKRVFNNVFLAYLLLEKAKRFLSNNQGTSIKGFLKKDLAKLVVAIPNIQEQNQIATTLQRVDDEINVLDEKLALYIQQKVYLLNNLITGAIRTPENLKIYDGD